MNLNLEKEIKSYTELNKQYEISFTKFILFFRTFATEGTKMVEKSNKFLEEYFIELRKEPSASTNNITFLSFYNDINRALNKLKTIFNDININIAEKLNEVLKKMVNNNNNGLERFTKLSQTINENKLKLEKFKYNYFNACKNVIEQEKRIIKLRDNKKVKEEDFIKNNEILGKYESTAENLESTYKSELNKFNKLLETSENTYNEIIKTFKDEYHNKLKSIYDSLEQLNKNVNTSNEINNELSFKIIKACKCLNIERDLALFSEKNNYYNENKKRFLTEKFLDYKLFINDEKNKKMNSKENINLKKDILNKYKKIINLGKAKGEDKTQNEEIIEFKNDEEKNVNDYLINLLKDENKIDKKKFEFISEFINKNPENINLVMDVLLNQFKKSSFIKLANLDNLNLLSQLLNSILFIATKNQNVFEANYIVIFLAEKMIYCPL